MRAAIFFVLFGLAGRLGAAGDESAASSSSIDRYLFPAELVMQHYEAIGLGVEQRHTIKEAVLSAQARFLDLQWKQ
jgi:hypothetical protein